MSDLTVCDFDVMTCSFTNCQWKQCIWHNFYSISDLNINYTIFVIESVNETKIDLKQSASYYFVLVSEKKKKI